MQIHYKTTASQPVAVSLTIFLAAFLIVGNTTANAEDSARPRQFIHKHVDIGSGIPAIPTPRAVGPRAAGLIIVPTFDSSITSDPRAADIMATINAAIAIYEKTYTNNVTVAITFQNSRSGLGSSLTNTVTRSYVEYRAALVLLANTSNDTTALAHLPISTNNPVNNDTGMTLTTALARAMGFPGDPGLGNPDSTVTLNVSETNITASDTDPNKYSLQATAEHEIDEVLGLGSQLDSGTTGPIYPEDLFRYDSSGARSFTRDASASSFFSLDGTTNLAQFNQDKSGDFGDWYSVNGGQVPQVQDAFGTPGDSESLGVELTVLDVIGWVRVNHTGPNVPPVISSPANCSPNPAPVGMPATFTVGATDANNDALTIAWDFGDGSSGSGPSTTHTYLTAGNFTATATITDGFGGSVTSSVAVQAILSINPATTTKQKFKLNFRTGVDGIDVTMTSANFTSLSDGTPIQFVIGDPATGTVEDSGTLFKGKATGNFGKFTVNVRNGTVRYVATRTSLQDLLALFGATNDDVSTTVQIPLNIFYNYGYYGGTFSFFYNAKLDKTGMGK